MPHPISLAQASEQIHHGELTSSELLDRCLEQIRRHEPRLRAWVLVDEDGARRAAEQCDKEAAAGKFRGPLDGLPIGIKDIIDVRGWPTKAGSTLRENHVAEADAPVVAALRDAGAIVLGKTVTVQFACFDPSPSRNPWDADAGPKHTPGGSSSGSAVAVAAGMCPGAIGTQTGGSLVRPSTYCGVATCKPTFGRVDRDGIVPVSYHFDHVGPIARRVADLELMLGCLPRSRDFAPPGATSATTDAAPALLEPPRLGVLGGFFEDAADEPIRRLTAATIERLRDAGARIERIDTAIEFAGVLRMHRRIMAVEAAAYHRESFARRRETYGPMNAALLDEGLAASAVDYAAALAWLHEYRRRVVRLLDGVDALVVPSTHTTAPPTLSTTGTSEFQSPWSCAGLPVVSIPCGLASDGMPGAIQLVGPYHAEPRLLAIAAWCEARIGFDNVPPGV
jgi:Asp-tRNA(Asn)/Glu-tRNA(Gln) amidotransferase A subunit family amidase